MRRIYNGPIEVTINYIVNDFEDYFTFQITKEKVSCLFSALSIADKFLPSGWEWDVDNQELWFEIKKGSKPIGASGDICSVISAKVDGGNEFEVILTPIFDEANKQ